MTTTDSKYAHLFIYLCLMFSVRETTRSCPFSSETLEFVTRCPKDKNEWNKRAEKKACWNIKQNCTSSPQNFLYHCLVNEYWNTTLEVCGENNTILGNKCGEYNTVGKVIQENEKLPCEKCPSVYKSTEAYKYQECYDFVTNSTSTTNKPLYSLEPINAVRDCKCEQRKCRKSSNNSFPTSSAILLVICLALLCGFMVVLVKCRRHIFCTKPRDETEKEHNDKYMTTEETGNSADQDKVENVPLVTGDHGDSANQGKVETVPGVTTGHGAGNKNREWICVVAIQIGHSHICYGFSESDDAFNVYTIEAGMKPSPKSIAKLLTENDKCKKYGFEAQDTLYKNKKFLDDGKHNYFDNLDVFVEKDGPKVKDFKGNIFSAVHIYKLLLQELVKDACFHLKSKLGKFDRSRVCFVFSLPNNMDDPKKQVLESASQQIDGLSKDNVKLIRRAEAVSFLLGDVNIDATVFNINMKNFPLQAGAKHAVLNIGSCGFEVTVLEVSGTDKPDRIITDSNFPPENWSGESPEQMLEKLFKLCFGDEVHTILNGEFFPEYSKIMVDFEKHKRRFKTSSFTINLPKVFKGYAEKETTTGIDRRIEKSATFKGKVHYEVDSVNDSIHLELYKDFFEYCFQEMNKKVMEYLNQNLKNCKEIRNLCVTGGYANRDCFREGIRKCLNDKTRIIPFEADLAVAKGAAYYR